MRSPAVRRAAAPLALAASLAACSARDPAPPAPEAPSIASFTADPPALYPGETVHLVAVFSGGSGSIEPDVGPIASGEAVVLKPGTTPKEYRLRVSDGARAVEATLPLAIAYRHRLDPLLAGLARADHAAALVDGRVLLAGGLTGAGFEARTERWDPAGGFSLAADLSTPHAEAAVATDARGTVLVTGGLDVAGVAPDAIEVFDPATGGFVTTARLAAGRLGLALVGLPDGAVLVHGGRVAGGAAVGDAALYR